MSVIFKRVYTKENWLTDSFDRLVRDSVVNEAGQIRGNYWQNVYKLSLSSELDAVTYYDRLAAHIVQSCSIEYSFDAHSVDINHILCYVPEDDTIREVSSVFEFREDMIEHIETTCRDVLAGDLRYLASISHVFHEFTCWYEDTLGLCMLITSKDTQEGKRHSWLTVLPDSLAPANPSLIADKFFDDFLYVGQDLTHQEQENLAARVLTDLESLPVPLPALGRGLTPRGLTALHPLTDTRGML